MTMVPTKVFPVEEHRAIDISQAFSRCHFWNALCANVDTERCYAHISLVCREAQVAHFARFEYLAVAI